MNTLSPVWETVQDNITVQKCNIYPFSLVASPPPRYLKEFRTEQCPLFVQHKCTQHRPFSCFHWHFLNQRRRRPIRRRDGTFNYSPDVYCTKYDEGTGTCPDGDEWVQLKFQCCTRLSAAECLHLLWWAPEKTHTFKKKKKKGSVIVVFALNCTTSHTVFGKLIVVTVTHLWKILFFTFCIGYFVSKSNLQGKGQEAFYRKSASLSLWL